jgi:hypothetical protein
MNRVYITTYKFTELKSDVITYGMILYDDYEYQVIMNLELNELKTTENILQSIFENISIESDLFSRIIQKGSYIDTIWVSPKEMKEHIKNLQKKRLLPDDIIC